MTTAVRSTPRHLARRVARRTGAHAVTFTAATSLAIAVIGALTGVIAARLLGPDGRGQLAAVQLWPLVLASLAMVGLPEALTYFSAKRAAAPAALVATALSVALPASLAVAALGWMAMPWLLRSQSAETVALARWFLLMCPAFALFGIPYHPLRGLERFTVWNVLRLGAPLSWLAALSICWASGYRSVGALVTAQLIATLIVGLVGTTVVRRQIGFRLHPAPGMRAPMVRFGLPAVLTTLPQMLNLRVDQMVMSSVLPSRELGLYVVAVSWSALTQPAVNALGLVLGPRVAAADESDRFATFARGVRTSIAPTILVTLLALPLTPLGLALLFGSSYADATAPALVLVVASGILATNYVLGEGLRGLGRPKIPLYAETFGLAVTAIALVALLGPLGIVGAAVASVAGYGAVFAAMARDATRTTGLAWRELLIPRRAELAATAGALRGLVRR